MKESRTVGVGRAIEAFFRAYDEEVETTRHGDFGDNRDGAPEINFIAEKPRKSLGQVVRNLAEDVRAVLAGEDDIAGAGHH